MCVQQNCTRARGGNESNIHFNTYNYVYDDDRHTYRGMQLIDVYQLVLAPPQLASKLGQLPSNLFL